MNTYQIYYPPTTASQRRVLFEAWEETHDVDAACQRAHTSRSTFYYWKPRFDQGGYAALVDSTPPGPARGLQASVELQARVVALKQQHPEWGKRRIADELAKAHSWVPVLSANTVRRILQEHGLWPVPAAPTAPPGFAPVTQTASEPGQSVNVDLCFVPAAHAEELKLPAVSGSSGKLIVERPAAETETAWYPGQVFAQADLSYAEAMTQFVTDSQLETPDAAASASPEAVARATAKAEKQALRQAEAALRVTRRQQRQARAQEDQTWRAARAATHQAETEQQAERVASQRAADDSQKATQAARRQRRQQRRAQLAQRQQEDAQWRAQRQTFREQLQATRLVLTWLAILVITDNCTRQCVYLPLFSVGAHVTADMVVAALRPLLPPELQFLISDRGVHFTAKVFQQFAAAEAFIHVLIARHRPQSNGIAERFVRTLKEWLRDKTWQSPEELTALLKQFRLEYNDRPHQGLPVPGLSPNEYANRLWVT